MILSKELSFYPSNLTIIHADTHDHLNFFTSKNSQEYYHMVCMRQGTARANKQSARKYKVRLYDVGFKTKAEN